MFAVAVRKILSEKYFAQFISASFTCHLVSLRDTLRRRTARSFMHLLTVASYTCPQHPSAAKCTCTQLHAPARSFMHRPTALCTCPQLYAPAHSLYHLPAALCTFSRLHAPASSFMHLTRTVWVMRSKEKGPGHVRATRAPLPVHGILETDQRTLRIAPCPSALQN